MANPPSHPDEARTGDDLDPGSDDGSVIGTPRWVKAFAIVFLVLVVLFVVLLLAGNHGPGRHTTPGDGGGDTPPPGIAKHGVQQA